MTFTYEATRFKSILSLRSLEISIVRSLTTQGSHIGFYAAGCWLLIVKLKENNSFVDIL